MLGFGFPLEFAHLLLLQSLGANLQINADRAWYDQCAHQLEQLDSLVQYIQYFVGTTCAL